GPGARPRGRPGAAGWACGPRVVGNHPAAAGPAGGEVQALGADLGVLWPNSCRRAWLLWRAGVKRRLGYAREWRSMLLTDRVHAVRRTAEQARVDGEKARAIFEISGGKVKVGVGSKYQPVPTIEYYLEMLRYLGGTGLDRRMELGITERERAEGEGAIQSSEFRIQNGFVVMVPGANFGASKCWMPERFAEVADRLVVERGATVLIASSPAEMPIVEGILGAVKNKGRVVALAKMNGGKGVSLGGLKEIVRRSSLMVCNDTGPRHFGVALGVPVVTLFGPTDPVWAETFYGRERQVRIEVPCGPCQLKKCPIDHRCMRGIEVGMVMGAVKEIQNSEFRIQK
ncbi:MAG: glycosyltransferase family 9 protein, partial [Phycisphaerae bacterium]